MMGAHNLEKEYTFLRIRNHNKVALGMVMATHNTQDLVTQMVDKVEITHAFKQLHQLMLQKLVKQKFACTMVLKKSTVPNVVSHNGNLVTKHTPHQNTITQVLRTC